MVRKPPKQQCHGRRQVSTASRERSSQDVSHVAYEGLKAMVTDIGLTPAEYERRIQIAAKRAGV